MNNEKKAKHPCLPEAAEIMEVIDETPNIKTFVLEPPPDFSFRTGQFVELTVPGYGEAPFTPSSSPHEKKKIEITIMKAGRVTARIHQLKPGDKVGLRGPFGAGYRLDDWAGKKIAIVGGGVGLAPIRSLLLALLHDPAKFSDVRLRFGARTPSDIVYKKTLPDWGKKVDLVVSVDKSEPGWAGKVGLVTTILEDLKPIAGEAVAVICGPPVMMKFTTFKLSELGFPDERIYLSMEKNMSCGLGQCGHCRLGNYYVCKDGPVFSYNLIKDVPDIWD